MFYLKNSLNRVMSSILVAGIGFAALLYGASPASAQVLGAAQSFAVLGGNSVTFGAPPSTINGDVGISSAADTFITGASANASITLPFTNHGNDAVAIAAGAATLTLFNSSELAPASGSAITANLSTDGPTANGHYTPGKYSLATGTAIIPTSITLDGPGIYVFSLNSDLTTSVSSTVILNGADPCDVFWRVPTIATLNGLTFPGTVVAGAGVHLGNGAKLTGRALTLAAGDVTMSAGGNIVGACSVPSSGVAPLFLAETTLSRTVPLPNGTVGTPMTDTKTLSGGLGSAAPTGTIIFTLFSDALCTTSVFTSSAVTVTGNGSFTSPSFTPTVPGTFHWIATYSGDPNNAPTATACADANEIVIVAAIRPGAAAGIPTLSGWGLMTLMALIGVASIYRLRRI
jgi:hypothetical protein